MRTFLGSAIAMLLVTGCGALTGQSSSTPLPLPSPPTAALAKWSSFPADANPRPAILFGDVVEQIGSGQFPDNDSKLTWVCNKFVLASDVQLTSAGPAVATARWPSGATASYPGIGSARAFAALMARPAGGNSTDCARLKPFVITKVRWASGGFPTDRGTATISAWLFDVPAAGGFLGYLGLDPSALWGGGIAAEGRGARVAADQRTLKVAEGNAEPGPCGSDYTASAAESNSAVAVAVKQIPHAPPGQPVACDLVLRVSYISLTLKSSLGGRVLLDENGNVGSACPEKGDC